MIIYINNYFNPNTLLDQYMMLTVYSNVVDVFNQNPVNSTGVDW